MKLEWTEPAVLDLESIRDYIARDSAYYAERFVARIIEAAETLPNHPRMGRPVSEAEDEAIRELIFQNYRIIYRTKADCIVILTVIHGGRDLSRLELPPWDVL